MVSIVIIGIGIVIATTLSVCLVTGACRLCHASPRLTHRAGWLAGIGVVVWVCWVINDWNQMMVRRWERIQSDYPIESLEERLDYEAHEERRIFGIGVRSHGSAVLAHAVKADLKASEQADDGEVNVRVRLLKQLHETTADAFADAFGFGVMRMESYIRGHLENDRHDSPLIDQPVDSTEPFPNSYSFDELVLTDPSRQIELATLHRAGRQEFLSSIRMAYVAKFRQAADFRGHQFSKVPTTPSPLKLVRLELLSLLKHPTPRVYVSKSLPNMQELTDVPTRPLNDFEARVLPLLATDDDVIIESTMNETRMLGSIRARKQCLQCHNVDRGELLGAFTYVLRLAG